MPDVENVAFGGKVCLARLQVSQSCEVVVKPPESCSVQYEEVL